MKLQKIDYFYLIVLTFTVFFFVSNVIVNIQKKETSEHLKNMVSWNNCLIEHYSMLLEQLPTKDL